jgi:nucleoside-diphosphate-sugar epimerase
MSCRREDELRTVVIGATGHIGTYLVPRLIAAGHDVVAVSRGRTEPYHAGDAWADVRRVVLDRRALERDGGFGRRIAALAPDAVVDLICFDVTSARQLADAVAGRVGQLVHCGTLWVHGPSEIVPTDETMPRRPFGDYGIRKAEIERYLLERARADGFPASVLHPGHIVGPGWPPINPAGHLDTAVFERLARGDVVALPDQGLATLHHVHADDVAQAFELALARPDAAAGEAFHVASPAAVTLLGYARAVAAWFGREARLELVPWPEWRARATGRDAALTWDHVAHSPCASIEKARTRLGYGPRYSSLDAVREALAWLIAAGRVQAPPGRLG